MLGSSPPLLPEACYDASISKCDRRRCSRCVVSAPAGAQQPQQGQAPITMPIRDMLTRGAQAMGFDQGRTDHHFLLYDDGGAIDVAVKEASDTRTFSRFDSTSSKSPDCSKLEIRQAGPHARAAGARDRGHDTVTDRITYQYRKRPPVDECGL